MGIHTREMERVALERMTTERRARIRSAAVTLAKEMADYLEMPELNAGALALLCQDIFKFEGPGDECTLLMEAIAQDDQVAACFRPPPPRPPKSIEKFNNFFDIPF